MIVRRALVAMAALSLTGAAISAHAAEWGYEGETGPANWHKLDPAFRMCGEGRNQSPVNITGVVEAELPPLKIKEGGQVTGLVHNGHTVKATVSEGAGLEMDGHHFALKQFHFHAPSENAVDGKLYPMEIHFVHADKDGNLAVVGVFVKKGAENDTLARLWKALPRKKGDTTKPEGVSATALLPKNRAYWRFNGSLTTPPCSEGVRWFVLKTPVEASEAQIQAFEKVMGHANNRPVQPLNARLILQ